MRTTTDSATQTVADAFHAEGAARRVPAAQLALRGVPVAGGRGRGALAPSVLVPALVRPALVAVSRDELFRGAGKLNADSLLIFQLVSGGIRRRYPSLILVGVSPGPGGVSTSCVEAFLAAGEGEGWGGEERFLYHKCFFIEAARKNQKMKGCQKCKRGGEGRRRMVGSSLKRDLPSITAFSLSGPRKKPKRGGKNGEAAFLLW